MAADNRNHVQARGLVLSFRETDIEQLAAENTRVQESFEEIGFTMQTLDFESPTYKRSLSAFLNGKKPGPRMIYINGHGGETGDGQLQLSGKPDGKKVAWSTILDLIGSAECDVLVILDCCNAGLAAATSLKSEYVKNLYSKELIVAGDWGTITQDRLAPALCTALKAWYTKSETRQATSLHRALLTIIKRMRDEAMSEKDRQIMACKKSLEQADITVSRLTKKAEGFDAKIKKENLKNKPGQHWQSLNDTKRLETLKRFDEERDEAWEEVAKAKEKVRDLQGSLKKWYSEREKIKERHPQPIYTKLNSRASPWILKGSFYNNGNMKVSGAGCGAGLGRRGSCASEY